jgi:type II secretory pathway component PulF
VIFSRQIATLFEAGVSALKAFRLLAAENDNKTLQQASDRMLQMILKLAFRFRLRLRSGPHSFLTFYVSMVRAGEESGKLKRRISLFGRLPRP